VTLFFAILGIVMIAPLGVSLLMHRLDNPKRRLRTGRMLLAGGDARCATCDRPHAGLVVRNRWLKDMPVCDACMVAVHGAAPTLPADERLLRRDAIRRLTLVPLTDEDFKKAEPEQTPPPRDSRDALVDALNMAWREGAIDDEEYKRLRREFLGEKPDPKSMKF
jgi:hypothetical protein